MKLSCICLTALVSQASAYEFIAGYSPGTNVRDHGNIDMDQVALEDALDLFSVEGRNAARAIYEYGGNSKSVATLNLGAATTTEIAKNTVFSGVGVGGDVVTATAYATYDANVNAIELKYAPETCLVGSLPDVTVTDGCFVTDGTVTDGTNSFNYTYDLTDNKAKRTLKGFSTVTESKMSGEEHANFFKDYYGAWDYGDQIATAALYGTKTDMPNEINFDFTNINFVVQEQIIKKGVLYMHVFMYAIHELESAIVECLEGVAFNQESAVHAWDEGVAFFVGNGAGNTGADKGNLIYALGNKRCKNYGTCGATGTETEGTAKVNIDIMALFNRGQDEINAGNCVAATATKDAIRDRMYVPLIQGSLRYAFKGANEDDPEKAIAEGTAFTLAVLGRINAASPTAAATIFNNMKGGETVPNTAEVKAAFESVYDAINVSCEDIGGLLNDDKDYYEGMEPCYEKCTDKGRGKKAMFTDPSSGLRVSCGALSVLADDLKEAFCSAGGATTCPMTCKGKCGCNDMMADKFTTNSGRSVTCAELGLMNLKKKNTMCKKKPVMTLCRDTCRGFCLSKPPF